MGLAADRQTSCMCTCVFGKWVLFCRATLDNYGISHYMPTCCKPFSLLNFFPRHSVMTHSVQCLGFRHVCLSLIPTHLQAQGRGARDGLQGMLHIFLLDPPSVRQNTKTREEAACEPANQLSTWPLKNTVMCFCFSYFSKLNSMKVLKGEKVS